VLAGGRLCHLELAGDEQAADPVFYQIPVYLLGEVPARRLEPLQDLQTPFIGNCAKRNIHFHIDN